jgi:hypothetical protein
VARIDAAPLGDSPYVFANSRGAQMPLLLLSCSVFHAESAMPQVGILCAAFLIAY